MRKNFNFILKNWLSLIFINENEVLSRSSAYCDYRFNELCCSSQLLSNNPCQRERASRNINFPVLFNGTYNTHSRANIDVKARRSGERMRYDGIMIWILRWSRCVKLEGAAHFRVYMFLNINVWYSICFIIGISCILLISVDDHLIIFVFFYVYIQATPCRSLPDRFSVVNFNQW